ncbi:MAG: energy transducer TonB [Zoogloeaceae bacterium]|jgi:TonB family protein|nr:energy transducer TonB [Zoogloeaceae bacterium]
MDLSRYFSIWQAVFCSVLIHGMVFSVQFPKMLEARENDLGSSVRLEARLCRGAAEDAGMPGVLPGAAGKARREERVPPAGIAPVRLDRPDAAKPQEAAVNTEASRIGVVATASSHGEEGRVGKGESPDATATETAERDGFDEYKWALQRAMKGKHPYPTTARLRGITGRVETRLVWLPDFAAPRVELIVSSGSHLLDEEALAILTRAARVTPLPEALRPRSFELSLTVDYSLE